MAKKRPKVGDRVLVKTGWAKGLVGQVTGREDHGNVLEVTVRIVGQTVAQRYPCWALERTEKGA